MQAGKLVQDGQQVREGVARVKHDRFLQLLRQAEHLAEDLLLVGLGYAVVVREVIIQADLSHRDHARVARELTQLAALGGVGRLTGRVWVPADGGP